MEAHQESLILLERACMSELKELVDDSRAQEKNLFLWDKAGQIPLYFDGVCADFTDDLVRAAMTNSDRGFERKVKAGLCNLRQHLMTAMSEGKPMLLNIGMLAPDFCKVYTDEGLFPAETLFNRKKWSTQHKEFMSKVYAVTNRTAANSSVDTDDTDDSCDVQAEAQMKPGFQLVIRSAVSEQADLCKVLKGIPNREDFRCVLIE